MLFAMASLELPKPGSRTQYTKCMFLSLSFLLFHRRKKNAIWQLFLSDPGIFNEEICESALSQLARAITSRPNLRVLEAANKTFKRLGLFSATCSGLCNETRLGEPEMNLMPTDMVSMDSPEIRHTLTFLERTIFSLGTNTYLEYDPTHSFVYAKDAAWRNLSHQIRFREIDITALLIQNLLKFKKQQLVNFIRSDPEVARFWPSALSADGSRAQPAADEPVALYDDEKDEEGSEVEDNHEPATESDDSYDEDEEDDAPLVPVVSTPTRTSRISSASSRLSTALQPNPSRPTPLKRGKQSDPLPANQDRSARPKRACAARREGNFAYALWASLSDDD